MSGIIDSRERVLGRIRAAARNFAAADPQPAAKDAQELAGADAAIPRRYARSGRLSAEARMALMAERLREYGAEVAVCKPEELAAAITQQIAASGRRIFVAPPGIPVAWRVEVANKIKGFECSFDHGLQIGEIEQAEGVITAAFCGIADSGTIVLHHSASEGRRMLTLLPDWHLCILKASQVVETLPEYFDRCPQPPALVTWISGPSATADIEMTRIQGVHGPRFLNVILADDRGKEPAVH